MYLRSIAIFTEDSSRERLYNGANKKGGGDMVKRQDMQLYYVILLAFKQAKLKGCSNDEAFEQAKTTLIDYFVSTGNVNKHSFAIIWGEMKKQHFTQQLYLDCLLYTSDAADD